MKRFISSIASIFLLSVFTLILCEDIVLHHDKEYSEMFKELEDVPAEEDEEMKEDYTSKLKIPFALNSDQENDDQTLFYYRFNLKTQIMEVQIPPPELCALVTHISLRT